MRAILWSSSVSVIVGLTLASAACGNEGSSVGVVGTTANLAPPKPSIVPDERAPAVVDTARVERAVEALPTRLAAVRDPEARYGERFAAFREAQADVMRDGELDRRSVLATSAAIRARLLGTEEAARDGEVADQARVERGEVYEPSAADRAAFARAAARVAERAGPRTAPAGARTSTEGEATLMRPPTTEELRNDPL